MSVKRDDDGWESEDDLKVKLRSKNHNNCAVVARNKGSEDQDHKNILVYSAKKIRFRGSSYDHLSKLNKIKNGDKLKKPPFPLAINYPQLYYVTRSRYSRIEITKSINRKTLGQNERNSAINILYPCLSTSTKTKPRKNYFSICQSELTRRLKRLEHQLEYEEFRLANLPKRPCCKHGGAKKKEVKKYYKENSSSSHSSASSVKDIKCRSSKGSVKSQVESQCDQLTVTATEKKKKGCMCCMKRKKKKPMSSNKDGSRNEKKKKGSSDCFCSDDTKKKKKNNKNKKDKSTKREKCRSSSKSSLNDKKKKKKKEKSSSSNSDFKYNKETMKKNKPKISSKIYSSSKNISKEEKKLKKKKNRDYHSSNENCKSSQSASNSKSCLKSSSSHLVCISGDVETDFRGKTDSNAPLCQSVRNEQETQQQCQPVRDQSQEILQQCQKSEPLSNLGAYSEEEIGCIFDPIIKKIKKSKHKRQQTTTYYSAAYSEYSPHTHPVGCTAAINYSNNTVIMRDNSCQTDFVFPTNIQSNTFPLESNKVIVPRKNVEFNRYNDNYKIDRKENDPSTLQPVELCCNLEHESENELGSIVEKVDETRNFHHKENTLDPKKNDASNRLSGFRNKFQRYKEKQTLIDRNKKNQNKIKKVFK